MFKYSVTANSKVISTIHNANDLDLALQLFISDYQSHLFDSVDFTDATTGEVLAYFRAEPFDLWRSDAVISHMIKAICESRRLGDLTSSLLR